MLYSLCRRLSPYKRTQICDAGICEDTSDGILGKTTLFAFLFNEKPISCHTFPAQPLVFPTSDKFHKITKLYTGTQTMAKLSSFQKTEKRFFK